jgi:hypothetical protein
VNREHDATAWLRSAYEVTVDLLVGVWIAGREWVGK